MSVSYPWYFLMGAEADNPNVFSTGGTGLIGTFEDSAVVATGTQNGVINLAVEVHNARPATAFDGWDDVVEVSVEFPGGEARIAPWAAFHVVAVALPRSNSWDYRVRVHARGRDAGRGGGQVDGGRLEEHLIVIWPGPSAPPIVWKAMDVVGAYLRRAEVERQSAAASEIDVRGVMATYTPADWLSPPEGSTGARLSVDQAFVRSAQLDVVLTAVTVYPVGCMFHLRVDARRSDLDDPAWQRRKAVVVKGFALADRSAGNRGQGVALSLTSNCPGQPPVRSIPLGSAHPGAAGQAPTQPQLTGWWTGTAGFPDKMTVDYNAWHWPLPPAQPWQLTVEWPALHVPPTTIELDGGIVANHVDSK